MMWTIVREPATTARNPAIVGESALTHLDKLCRRPKTVME